MKRLDRYIIANFVQGYLIAGCILIGLRIVIDLFVNLDEFAKNADLGGLVVARNIVSFYAFNSTLYYRDFAGMILVVAAAFCIARMVRYNELIAIMASGLSLRRVMLPIMIMGLVMTAVLVLDQEVVIPRLADRLVRGHDVIPGQESFRAWFIPGQDGSLIFSPSFDLSSGSFDRPAIILRQLDGQGLWNVTGCIVADKAIYNEQLQRWDLINGRLINRDPNRPGGPVLAYGSMGLLPKDIPILAKSEFKGLLSWRQLDTLGGLRPRDMALLFSQKHFRITEPLINLLVLLVGLPVLLCRDPRYVKSAVLWSFCLTGACSIVTFVCKVLSTEPVPFGRPMPQLWAWLPVLIFLPIGLVELDSIKT